MGRGQVEVLRGRETWAPPCAQPGPGTTTPGLSDGSQPQRGPHGQQLSTQDPSKTISSPNKNWKNHMLRSPTGQEREKQRRNEEEPALVGKWSRTQGYKQAWNGRGQAE